MKIAGSTLFLSFPFYFSCCALQLISKPNRIWGAQSQGPSTEPRSVYGWGRNQACDEVVYRTRRYTLGACRCAHIPALINISHILLNSATSHFSVHMKQSIIDTSVLDTNDVYYINPRLHRTLTSATSEGTEQGWPYFTSRFPAVFLICPSLALLGGFGMTPGPSRDGTWLGEGWTRKLVEGQALEIVETWGVDWSGNWA